MLIHYYLNAYTFISPAGNVKMRDFERAARGRGGADAVATVTGEQEHSHYQYSIDRGYTWRGGGGVSVWYEAGPVSTLIRIRLKMERVLSNGYNCGDKCKKQGWGAGAGCFWLLGAGAA